MKRLYFLIFSLVMLALSFWCTWDHYVLAAILAFVMSAIAAYESKPAGDA